MKRHRDSSAAVLVCLPGKRECAAGVTVVALDRVGGEHRGILLRGHTVAGSRPGDHAKPARRETVAAHLRIPTRREKECVISGEAALQTNQGGGVLVCCLLVTMHRGQFNACPRSTRFCRS